MISKIVLGLFVVVVLVVLARALIRGRIEVNPAGADLRAERKAEPGAFWIIFCTCLAAVFYMIWLITN